MSVGKEGAGALINAANEAAKQKGPEHLLLVVILDPSPEEKIAAIKAQQQADLFPWAPASRTTLSQEPNP